MKRPDGTLAVGWVGGDSCTALPLSDFAWVLDFLLGLRMVAEISEMDTNFARLSSKNAHCRCIIPHTLLANLRNSKTNLNRCHSIR